MIHNRRKSHKKTPFKSSTDINNYNTFLKKLDKKQSEKNEPQIIENKLEDKNPFAKSKYCDSKSCDYHKKYDRKNIKIFVKNSQDDFVKGGLNESSFTGISAWEAFINQIEKHLEPNMYDKKDDEKRKENEVIDKTFNEPNKKPVYTKKVHIDATINHVGDLLQLIENYPDDNETEYNIDMKILHKIKVPLVELNSMIGMKELKENIVDQLLFYIQNLHTLDSRGGNDFMHTVICGPPGTGKTEIAKIIGSIFSKMGVLSKGTFKKVTRADLVAGYLGQTALKTREVVKECLGGVLFIDEAYALGNEEKRDSFSKECIDTLCESLSDYKHNLMVIIAGYEKELNECFFDYNQGLNSRFTWRFKTGEYNAEDLYKIFVKKVNDGGWYLSNNSGINVQWFEKHKSHFKFYGRDIETLFAKTKIAHSRRVFCLDASVKKHLTLKDLEEGLKIYLKNNENNEKDKHNKLVSSMYV
jgi:hypothetical protein